MWFRSVYFKIGFRADNFFYTNGQYIDGIVVVGNGECHTSVAVAAPFDSGSGIAAALQVTSGNLPINADKTVCGKAVVYCAVLTNAKTNACFNLFDQIVVVVFSLVVVINTPYFLIPGQDGVVCCLSLYT